VLAMVILLCLLSSLLLAVAPSSASAQKRITIKDDHHGGVDLRKVIVADAKRARPATWPTKAGDDIWAGLDDGIIYSWGGFRSLFSGTGFEQVASDLSPIIQKAIAGISISGISGSIGTPIGVDIDYRLDNIALSQWNFGKLSTKVVSDPAINNGVIRVHWDQISFRIDLNFHYSALFISGSGTASVNVVLNMDADLLLTNRNGEPQVTAASVNPTVQRFDVSVHGGASWFYEVFIDIFNGKLKDVFSSALRTEVTHAIAGINDEYLSRFPIKMVINDVVGINYGLLPDPINPYIASYGAITNHVGQFYWLDGNADCPYPSSEMIPDLDQLGDRNLQLLVHQSLITSAGCAYLAAGKLKLTLDQTSIPPTFPVQLNTSYWQYFMPNLYQKFPNEAMMFKVTGTNPPVTTISPTVLHEAMTFNTTCYVILSDGVSVPVFTIGTNVSGEFTTAIREGNLTVHFNSLTSDLRVLASAIGDFDVKLLQVLADFIISDIFMPILNSYGYKGIPLAYISSEDLALTDITLSFRPEYLVISTNFNISLTTKTVDAVMHRIELMRNYIY